MNRTKEKVSHATLLMKHICSMQHFSGAGSSLIEKFSYSLRVIVILAALPFIVFTLFSLPDCFTSFHRQNEHCLRVLLLKSIHNAANALIQFNRIVNAFIIVVLHIALNLRFSFRHMSMAHINTLESVPLHLNFFRFGIKTASVWQDLCRWHPMQEDPLSGIISDRCEAYVQLYVVEKGLGNQ